MTSQELLKLVTDSKNSIRRQNESSGGMQAYKLTTRYHAKAARLLRILHRRKVSFITSDYDKHAQILGTDAVEIINTTTKILKATTMTWKDLANSGSNC